jgi:glutamyl-Q tRNA(Asp) synthetase
MVAAVGSYLDARSHAGMWEVRIDDFDWPRVVPGASAAILQCLQAFGMHWDGEPVFQSRRADAYHAALHHLSQRNLLYTCACSRRDVEEAGLAGIEGSIYPGTCREGLAGDRPARALRVRTGNARIAFLDRLQGLVQQSLEQEVGDFVLYRADRIYSYHLACAVDDAAQGITHVVRGADLIASTPRQIYLQQLLGLPTPAYLHLPLATHPGGEKLSKQTLAPAVNTSDPAPILRRILNFLGHSPPSRYDTLDALWPWAIANWRIENIPAGSRSIT